MAIYEHIEFDVIIVGRNYKRTYSRCETNGDILDYSCVRSVMMKKTNKRTGSSVTKKKRPTAICQLRARVKALEDRMDYIRNEGFLPNYE